MFLQREYKIKVFAKEIQKKIYKGNTKYIFTMEMQKKQFRKGNTNGVFYERNTTEIPTKGTQKKSLQRKHEMGFYKGDSKGNFYKGEYNFVLQMEIQR